MKYILIALAALAITSKAQTTNVIFSILVEEPTRTNTLTVSASAKEVRGLNVEWEVQITAAAQTTNSPPSFRKSVQNWLQNQTATLQPIADADERRRSKITDLLNVISLNYDALNASQKQQLKDIAASVVQ